MILCPEEVNSAFDRLTNARTAYEPMLDWDFFNYAPNEEAGQVEFTVYPNPVENGIANINLASDYAGEVTVNVISVEGKKVESFKYTVNVGSNELKIIYDWKPGMYIIEIQSETLTKSTSVIVK